MMQLKLLFLLFIFKELQAVPLLLSWLTSIRLLESENPSNISSALTTHLSIAVDYHYKRGEIYFSDGTGRIHRSWLGSEGFKKTPVVILEVFMVDGLAVDWLNDNLYWTDVQRKTIEMATLDGLDRRVLFNAADGLQKPRAIVVDPSEGLLFASDWGINAQVFSSGLDGKGKTTLSTDVYWPNGLTLDLNKKKLYILDGLRATLSSCNYDGSDFQQLFKSPRLLQEGFSITYFSNKLYWTSWKEKNVISINLANKQTAALLNLNKLWVYQRMMGLKAIDASLQPESPRSSSCDEKHCSHRCLPGRQGTASCMCPFGSNLHHDEKTCEEEGYLLVSWRKTIRRLDLNGSIQQSLIDATKAAISIDIHLKKGLVFWSDIEEHRIYSAPLEQLNNLTVVATVETSDGLAVDWVHDVVYWTDASKQILEAASLDGTKRTTLINQDLDQPRAVALDPLEGMLFWSDWGTNSKIESANLDGSNRKIIIKDDIVWPNDLTINFDQKRLYWTDGMLAVISSCLYDGSKRNQILGTQVISLQPFGITILKDYIYWTDWKHQTVMKTLNTEGLGHTKVLANSSAIIFRPNGIKAVHSSLQKNQDNPCKMMNCKSLCVGSPSAPRKAHCLKEDIKADTPVYNSTEGVSQCGPGMFRCSGGKCIPSHNVCNYQKDCEKGDDEFQACPPPVCESGQLSCGQYVWNRTYCIPPQHFCDMHVDCVDGTDEADCTYRECQPDDFHCSQRMGGPCLPKEKRCDGYFDCRNGRDEEGCGATHGISCPITQFRCANGQRCIESFLKCNHRNDCGDNSDEEGCMPLSKETSELDDAIINVKNDSFQISFSAAKNASYIAITSKCLKREGCTVDIRCSEDNEKTVFFNGDDMPFTVSGLLPSSNYSVRLKTESASRDFHVITSSTDPPELPKLKSIDVKGTNVTINWDPVDTCVPDFHSYKYRIYKADELVLKGTTNLTETHLTGLQPLASYRMHLFTSKETHYVPITFETQTEDGLNKCQTEEFICDGKKDCSDGIDEDVNLCAGIKSLIVHKKTKSDVYFRCIVPNSTAKHLIKFIGNYSIARNALEEHFEIPAVYCDIWPESYCFHISNLDGNTVYIFNVSAVIKSGTIGNKVSATALTKEGVPGPPEGLHVVSYSPTSVELQWRHPNQTNGLLRNFVINIQEVETFDKDMCCMSFPMTEAPVQQETAIYSAKPGGFSPASTYAISITSKTLYLGGSKEIDVHTPPPPMEIQKMPELEVASLTHISWRLRDEEFVDQPQYTTLIKCYILLLLGPKADRQLPSSNGSSIEIGPIMPLLDLKIGAEFSVLWKQNADDAAAFKEPIKVTGLTPRKQYELAWVQVSQYKDVFSLDHILSEAFIAV